MKFALIFRKILRLKICIFHNYYFGKEDLTKNLLAKKDRIRSNNERGLSLHIHTYSTIYWFIIAPIVYIKRSNISNMLYIVFVSFILPIDLRLLLAPRDEIYCIVDDWPNLDVHKHKATT